MAMERLETLLAQWRSTEPETIGIDSIQTDAAYQPRNIILVPFKDRGKEERASEQHTADLAARLECGGNLEPVLVARIDGMLMLIDGHHRLGAYQKAGRTHIPARIRDSTKRQAFVVSKAANCDGVKLRMHNEQRREGAWQYLALKTKRGRQELPKGISLRGIGRTFGVGHNTISLTRIFHYPVRFGCDRLFSRCWWFAPCFLCAHRPDAWISDAIPPFPHRLSTCRGRTVCALS